MKVDPTLYSLVIQSESSQLQERIEEISLATRTMLADAAQQVRQEIAMRDRDRDDTLMRVALMLEQLASETP
jgi:hypothetical protein